MGLPLAVLLVRPLQSAPTKLLTLLRLLVNAVALNKPRAIAASVGLTALLVAVALPTMASDATQPRLGTAAGFAVLASTTVTNTGPSVVTGDLGLYPGTSVTGFGGPGSGSVVGTQHIAPDAVASLAQTDLVTAFNDAASATSSSSLTGDLGGKNLTPGVYTYSSSAQLTGPLTLNGDGVFIFQVGSTLTTATASSVVLVNGAQACAVYWQVGSSATLGGATQFQGNLMASTSITMVTGANLTGRALALHGAVTLDTNQVTRPTGTCTVAAAAGASPSAIPGTASPGTSTTPSGTPSPGVRLPGAGAPPTPPAIPWWAPAVALTLAALPLGLGARARRRPR